MYTTLSLRIATLLGAATLTTQLQAAVLFTDSVESPTVSGLSTTAIPAGWLESNQGFGSGNQGLANEGTLNFTTPYGNQALQASFATNSGWTTASGVIGTLVTGVTYTLTLNVAANTASAVNYQVALLAFDPLQTVRNDVRGNPPTANGAILLGSSSGEANTDNMTQTVTINYTATALTNGRDLAIRIRANESLPVYFDNFRVADNTLIPEPSLALLGGLGTLLLLRRRRN